jgi:hypothetical protein
MYLNSPIGLHGCRASSRLRSSDSSRYVDTLHEVNGVMGVVVVKS